MPRRDPSNEQLDKARKAIQRALMDLEIARKGDRGWMRISIIQGALHEATMALYEVKEEERAREPQRSPLRLTTSIITPAPPPMRGIFATRSSRTPASTDSSTSHRRR